MARTRETVCRVVAETMLANSGRCQNAQNRGRTRRTSDYVLTSLSNIIQAKHGFKPTTESLVALVSGKADSITAFGKSTVHTAEIGSILKEAVRHLLDHSTVLEATQRTVSHSSA